MKTMFKLLASAAICIFLLPACNVSVFPLESDAAAPKHYVLSVEMPNTTNTELPAIPFGRISVPAYLDVPQIVTRSGNRIARRENFRWGEPLVRGVTRNLALRCAVLAEGKKLALAETSSVRVTLERFDGELNGNVEISALYSYPTPDASAETSRIFKKSIPVESPNDYDAYVHALSRALDALAEEIVSAMTIRE